MVKLLRLLIILIGIVLVVLVAYRISLKDFQSNFALKVSSTVSRITPASQQYSFNLTAAKKIERTVSKHIHRWQAAQIYFPHVADKNIVFETREKIIRKNNRSASVPPQKLCAIVGNSGILLDSGCGDVIDTFQFVIRLNLAPSGGAFAPHVGSKVNLSTFNLAVAENLTRCTSDGEDYSENVAQKRLERRLCGGKMAGKCIRDNIADMNESRERCVDLIERAGSIHEGAVWYFKGKYAGVPNILSELRRRYRINLTFAYSPGSIMGTSSKVWNVSFPTTGLAIYTAATQFCQKIALFGFYPFPRDPRHPNRTLQHHYYEGIVVNYTANVHDMSDEYRILSDLNRTGAIRLINDCTSEKGHTFWT